MSESSAGSSEPSWSPGSSSDVSSSEIPESFESVSVPLPPLPVISASELCVSSSDPVWSVSVMPGLISSLSLFLTEHETVKNRLNIEKTIRIFFITLLLKKAKNQKTANYSRFLEKIYFSTHFQAALQTAENPEAGRNICRTKLFSAAAESALFAFNFFLRIIDSFLGGLYMIKPVFLFFPLFFSFFVYAETNVYKISMMGAEIGKSTETWEEKRNPDGSCEINLHSVSEMSLARGIDSMTIKSDTTLSADCNTLEPRKIKGEISEGGSKIFVEGTNRNGVFQTNMTKNGTGETSSFQVKKNTTFFGMIFKKLSDEELLKGGKTSIISEESLAESEVSYSASKNADGTVSATVVFQGIPIKYTVSNKKVLRSEIQNGLIVYTLESLPETKTATAAGSHDILQNTKLFNSGISIKYPRKTKNTIFQIETSDFASIPETCFQKKGNGTLTVSSDAADCKNLPESSDTQPNIIEDSGNPEIIRAAQKIVLGAPNQQEMVKRITKFVYKHISNKNYNHGNMSAGEVLRTKSGDCTEHSALFAALARAAGIPAKMVYGVVLNSNGEFFFHNWNEVFADGKWIPVDSTYNMDKADSSRITLIYGGSDSRSREQVSLSVLRFLNNTRIFARGFSNEK